MIPTPTDSPAMPLLSRMTDAAILAYSARFADHPGKWRVSSALLRAARMDERHRGGDRVARRGGLLWELDTACWVQRTVFYHGEWDAPELRMVMRAVPAGGVFLDVGSYFGWYALMVARRRPTARVHAFEPVPSHHRRLERNRARNGLDNVVCVPSAVGALPGSAMMRPPTAENGGNGGIIGAADDHADQLVVPVTTLDAYADAQRLTRVDAVKIDVEGAELEVLRGAAAVLRRFRPVLLVELNPTALRSCGAEPGDLLEALEGLGYQLYAVEQDGEVSPFRRADLGRPELVEGYVNLLCRPRPGGER